MYVKSRLFFYSIFLLIFNLLYAQPDFRFPVDINPDLSGSFGDLRKNHFHTGLDIRTGGKTGVPVYAVADGWVYRLKSSPYGFGNAVYLLHQDGYMSVYAHLEKFIPVLEDSILKRQKLTRLNSADWYLPEKTIPVKKGDLIAWSGNSGSSGGPHLHFEIREDEEHILNPLRFYKNTFQDIYRPVPEKIAFEPLSPGALVQGKPDKKEFTPVSTGSGKYKVTDTIKIYGRVGLEYIVSDKIGSGSFRINVPFTELYLDDKLIFSYKMEKFGFEQKRYVNKHLDYSRHQSGSILIQHCYTTDGNQLNCYVSEGNSGYISFTDFLTHHWKIIFRDYHGNSSEVNGWIRNEITEMKIKLPEISPVKPVFIPKYGDHSFSFKILNADKKNTQGLELTNTNGEKNILKPLWSQGQEQYYQIPVERPFPVQIHNLSGSIQHNFAYKTLIYPEKSNEYSEGGLRLTFLAGSNLDTLALEILEQPLKWNTWSPVYTIGRKSIPLMRAVEISLKPSRPVPDSSKVYIARCEGSKQTYLDEQKRSENKYAAQFSEFGSFCLVCDLIAPSLGAISYKPGMNLSFSATDSDSGIDSDRTSVFINAEWVPAEWNPGTHKFTVLKKYLPGNKFKFEIILKDKVGNESKKEGHFQ